MKVIVKKREEVKKFYIPNFLLGSGVKIINYIMNETDNFNGDIEVFINMLDMDFINFTLKNLKGYKGLELVNFKEEDGMEVIINM